MRKLFILLFSAVLFISNAQNFRQIDEIMTQFQSTFDENTVVDVATFINNNFSTETDKLRAVFVWVTENFEYDVENTLSNQSYLNVQEVISSMLRNRRGVCLHYAHLFSEIANELGIKTFVVSGITMQNGLIDSELHIWNASLVNSVWYLIDPTWGAGFLQNRRFVQRRNNFFF
jgi:transglutaminase/protease-like cytokinesis protein 3